MEETKAAVQVLKEQLDEARMSIRLLREQIETQSSLNSAQSAPASGSTGEGGKVRQKYGFPTTFFFLRFVPVYSLYRPNHIPFALQLLALPSWYLRKHEEEKRARDKLVI